MERYNTNKQIYISGVLDEDNDGNMVIAVNGTMFNFEEVFSEMKGHFVEIKCSNIENMCSK